MGKRHVFFPTPVKDPVHLRKKTKKRTSIFDWKINKSFIFSSKIHINNPQQKINQTLPKDTQKTHCKKSWKHHRKDHRKPETETEVSGGMRSGWWIWWAHLSVRDGWHFRAQRRFLWSLGESLVFPGAKNICDWWSSDFFLSFCRLAVFFQVIYTNWYIAEVYFFKEFFPSKIIGFIGRCLRNSITDNKPKHVKHCSWETWISGFGLLVSASVT